MAIDSFRTMFLSQSVSWIPLVIGAIFDERDKGAKMPENDPFAN